MPLDAVEDDIDRLAENRGASTASVTLPTASQAEYEQQAIGLSMPSSRLPEPLKSRAFSVDMPPMNRAGTAHGRCRARPALGVAALPVPSPAVASARRPPRRRTLADRHSPLTGQAALRLLPVTPPLTPRPPARQLGQHDLPVGFAGIHQLSGCRGHDPARVQDQDLVGVPDRADPLRDDDHVAPVIGRQRSPQPRVGGLVERRERVVEQVDLRLAHQRPRDRQPLALAAGHVRAVLCDRRVQPVRHPLDEVAGLGDLQGPPQVASVARWLP